MVLRNARQSARSCERALAEARNARNKNTAMRPVFRLGKKDDINKRFPL
jgi:hypothetical protein